MPGKTKVKAVNVEDVVLKDITVGIHKDKITFESLSFTAGDNDILTDIIKADQNAEVRVTFTLSGEPDKNFPPIAATAILKSNKISKTYDTPMLDGLKYSEGQVSKIVGYIRSEAALLLEIEQIQQELPLKG